MKTIRREKPALVRIPGADKAVTLIELLVVLAILALLATLAIPVYVQRAEGAKVKVAMEECSEIAKAEEMCGVLHGFYVPIQVLDDIPPWDDTGTIRRIDPYDDNLANESENRIHLIDPNQPVWNQWGNQLTLADRNTNARVKLLYEAWQGPFLNPQRVFIGDNPSPAPRSFRSVATVRHDFPLDPWGQPYRMYSPLGLVGSDARNTDLSAIDSDSFSDGQLTRYDADRFDRFAIVSFGRDGDSDTNTGGTDDVIHFFGIVAVETVYRIF